MGRPRIMGWAASPTLLTGRPCDLSGCAASTNPSVSFARCVSHVNHPRGGYDALDSAGCPPRLLRGRDQGAAVRCARPGGSRPAPKSWSCSRKAWRRTTRWRSRRPGRRCAIARMLEPHVGRVVIANTAQGAGDRRGEGEDRQGRRPDALRAARRRLLPRGLGARRVRRGRCGGRLARRDRLVRQRTRAKNERARGARAQPEGTPADDATSSGERGRELARGARAARRRARRPSTAACARSTSSTREVEALERELARHGARLGRRSAG